MRDPGDSLWLVVYCEGQAGGDGEGTGVDMLNYHVSHLNTNVEKKEIKNFHF